MQPLKQEAIDEITKLADAADIDEIMYRLYVLDKIRKGREDVANGDTLSTEALKREMAQW